MDRNFFFAMALSFVVLLGYQAIFVIPKQQEILKNTQVIDNKEVATTSTPTSSLQPEKQKETTNAQIKEEIIKLKTTEMSIELSNVGASLHNIEFTDSKKELPIENLLLLKGFESANFKLTKQTEKSATYVYENLKHKISKNFELKGENELKINFSITNLSNISSLENIEFKLITVNNLKVKQKDEDHSSTLEEISILENNKIIRRGSSGKFSEKDNKQGSGEVNWVGFRNHFKMVLIKPIFEAKDYENEMLSEKGIAVNIKPKEEKIEPGQTKTYEFTLVAGNQDTKWLKSFNQGFEKIVAFSGFWILNVIGMGIYYTIPFLHSICKSWGFSIILVSVLIYGLTYPLTLKSMSSMKKMQLIQPKVAALQKRYKDDPKKLNSEMIDIYKREGVNPLAGCLPFLLQMPIFIALYQVLWRSYYFQGKSFLWIKDLAQPDRLFTMPFSLPFLGSDFNILPLTMAGVMYVQQSITSKSMVITDDTQAMQQKMMKYIFPFFIGFIFYKFASGLSLYFTVFYALSAWTQWKVTKSK